MSEIKLISYNLDHSIQRERISKNIKGLAERGAQLFCLQEIRTPKGAEEFIGDTILKNLGASWQARFFLGQPSNIDYGLGFIWNTEAMQLVEFHNLQVPLLPNLTLLDRFIEFFLSGDTRPVKRGVMIGTFRAAEQTFRVSNTHFDWQGKFKQRFKQLRYLFEHLQASPVQSEIICGDFNTVGFFGNTGQMEKIQSLFGPEFVNLFPRFVLTTSHHQQLDHVFARNFKPGLSEALRMPGSDHFPIMATLGFVSDSESAVSVNGALNQGKQR